MSHVVRNIFALPCVASMLKITSQYEMAFGAPAITSNRKRGRRGIGTLLELTHIVSDYIVLIRTQSRDDHVSCK